MLVAKLNNSPAPKVPIAAICNLRTRINSYTFPGTQTPTKHLKRHEMFPTLYVVG